MFNGARIPRLSRSHPHLFSALLTVASKEDAELHQICYDHMKELRTNLFEGSNAGVEAVIALLILALWVSHQPKAQNEIGRGEEDRVAWMYIGTAIRLAYFLRIDTTSFLPRDGTKVGAQFKRNRLIWTACYMCDRLVSVRLGRGFWSRGPGPLPNLQAKDFESLQPNDEGQEHLAEVFQANLELTQIFSIVHDQLYYEKVGLFI
jgi:hypothetical protein